MTEEQIINRKRIIDPINWIKDLGWFSRLCILGGIFMIIDAILEFNTSRFGPLVLIFSILIIVMSTQIQDDNPYSYLFIIGVMISNYFSQTQFHSLHGLAWATGLGYLGSQIINIFATIALILIIVSVAASVNTDPIRDLWLFMIGFILIGFNLYIYLFFTPGIVLDLTSMLAIFYFSLISICFILMLFNQKILGAFIIWLISIIGFISGLIGGNLGTPVTGFGAGLTIVGNICLLFFINELGLLLINPDKEVKIHETS